MKVEYTEQQLLEAWMYYIKVNNEAQKLIGHFVFERMPRKKFSRLINKLNPYLKLKDLGIRTWDSVAYKKYKKIYDQN